MTVYGSDETLEAPKKADAITVVIPTLDAAAVLPACIRAIEPGRDAGVVAAVIVADGGSTDGTHGVARLHGCTVVDVPRGRGRQLRAGAEAAETPWLLFLHADTRLAPSWLDAARTFTADPVNRDRAGVFRLAYTDGGRPARRVARWANRRTRWLGLPYGDQGLLIHRDLYRRVGGYPDVPLMEDVALARRLRRRRIAPLNADAVTSPARYECEGWWWRPLKNLTILSLYFTGVPPRVLQRLYG